MKQIIFGIQAWLIINPMLHSERPKLYTILAFLSARGLIWGRGLWRWFREVQGSAGKVGIELFYWPLLNDTCKFLSFRPDFTSNLIHGSAFGTPKLYIAPYDKINHGLVFPSSNCDMKSCLSLGRAVSITNCLWFKLLFTNFATCILFPYGN